MKKNKLRLTLLVVLGLCGGSVMAQDAVVSSGGEATGAGGTLSYSLGQVAYKSSAGTDGTVERGVQQVFRGNLVTNLTGSKAISLSAYPNPSVDAVYLSVGGYNDAGFSYQLLDLHGKVIREGNIYESETAISVQDIPTGNYLIRVFNDEHLNLQSFNIIKN